MQNIYTSCIYSSEHICSATRIYTGRNIVFLYLYMSYVYKVLYIREREISIQQKYKFDSHCGTYVCMSTIVI